MDHNQLATRLRDLGLTGLAECAGNGMYLEMSSPCPLPQLRLVRELAAAATRDPDRAVDILALRQEVVDGKFK